MKFIQFLILTFVIVSASCQSDPKETHMYTNALIDESSPYLLQHAHNPVNWYPWKEEALQKAKEENKMLIISIGYSACHWCHVMEHESFEDEEVSKIMNENFISIKVDREERPDVDDVYMTACHLASGKSCGWPLNAFALPDGRPVWAGTYFPKKNWMEILEYFVKLYKEDKTKLEEYATQLTEGIQGTDDIVKPVEFNNEFKAESLEKITKQLESQIDFKWGGRQGAPKFPMPTQYEFLLRQYFHTGSEKTLEAITTTLDQMAKGGIYDQLGGGFARYSTDSEWKVPHFEKMLYDNSQLVSLYSHAYQVTKKPLYKRIVDETLRFIERELTDQSGGFYSSLDADSEGEEGKFYVWKKSEIDSVLQDQKAAELFNDYYEITTNGNWEHTNILYIRQTLEALAKRHKLTLEHAESLLQLGRNQLFEARSNRIRPGLDDKVLTSWNALMLQGYIDAYRTFKNPGYLEKAISNGQFLLENMLIKDSYRLHRNYKDGRASIAGFLDDYATTIAAFTKLYEVTFDEKWLDHADRLAQTTIEEFFDQDSELFFYTSNNDAPLIARKKEIADNVIPASNSMMARALFQLGTYLNKKDYISKSQRALQVVAPQFVDSDQSSYYSNWAEIYSTFTHPPYEIAIVGPNHLELQQELAANYLPNAFLLGGKQEGNLELLKNKLVEGETYIYVCQNKVCQLPVMEVEKALEQMQ